MKKWLNENYEMLCTIRRVFLGFALVGCLVQAKAMVMVLAILLAIIHIISAYIKRYEEKEMIDHGLFAALYIFLIFINL